MCLILSKITSGDIMKNKALKKESKIILKGKTKQAILISLFVIMFMLFSTLLCAGIIFFGNLFSDNSPLINAAIIVLLLIISVPALFVYSSASVGEKAWYNGITENKSNYIKRLFFWFKPKYSYRALKFHLILFIIKSFWATLYFLPAAILLWSIYYLSGTGGIEYYLFISLSVGSVLLFLCGAIFYLISIQRYFLAEYLYSSNPRLGAIVSIRQSKNLLDGHILEIVKFKISFIPKLLSCILIVPAFFVIPYYKETCCVVAKKITL